MITIILKIKKFWVSLNINVVRDNLFLKSTKLFTRKSVLDEISIVKEPMD